MTDHSMISTDTHTKIDRAIHVYYNPKPTIKVCLKFMREEVGSLTLSELIAKSIKLLNEDNMRKFFLEEVNKTFSLISTEFNLERKYGLEKKGGYDGACCQLFKILKT